MKQNSAAGVNFCIQVRYFWHHGRYINNILTVGMVPALFPDDEKEPLVGAIRARCGTVTLVLKNLPDCSPVSMFRARGEGVSETGMWAYACGAIYSAWAPCIIDPLQTKWQSMAKCRLFWLCIWDVPDLHSVQAVQVIRDNLHLVLAMSPAGSQLRWHPSTSKVCCFCWLYCLK